MKNSNRLFRMPRPVGSSLKHAFSISSHRVPPLPAKLLATIRPTLFGSDVYLDDLAGNLGEDVTLSWRDRYGSDIYLAAYSMPSELFSVLGEGLWFDSVGNPKQVNTVELAQSDEINTWAVWYRLDYSAGYGYLNVYVYDPDLLTVADTIEIAEYFKSSDWTPLPEVASIDFLFEDLGVFLYEDSTVYEFN